MASEISVRVETTCTYQPRRKHKRNNKKTRHISRSHMGGGNVFHKTNAVYARIEWAIDGRFGKGGR